MAEEGFGTVAEELRQNRLEQRRSNALTEKILEDRYKDDLPAERFKDNLFEIVNDRLINTKLMTRITDESGEVEDLNKSSNKFLAALINLQEGIFLQQANYFAQQMNINAQTHEIQKIFAVQFDKGTTKLGRTQEDALRFFIANFQAHSKKINESIKVINEEEKESRVVQLEMFEENEKKEEKRFAFFSKISERIGNFTVKKLDDLKISIKKNLKGLASFIFKPLTSLAKGIKELPNKILGFFGTTFGIIGRLALLGVGIFALSRLTDFLRNVGPGGQQSFVDSLMRVYNIAEAVLVGLKDVIMDVVIPALGVFANAIFGMVKFLAQKGLLPGVALGSGIKKKEEARIRKELLADPKIAAMPENVREDIIMGAIKKAEEERFKEFLSSELNFLGLSNEQLMKLGVVAPGVGIPANLISIFLRNLRKDNPEFLENVIRDFKIRESDNLFIFDKKVPNIGQRLDEIKKNTDDKMGGNVNIGASISKQDIINNIDPTITYGGNANALNTE